MGHSLLNMASTEMVQGETRKTFEREVERGQRFEFGKNWKAFLSTLDDERIRVAEESLKTMLGVSDLHGKTFLDAGSGSGLFSLAARRLGARVHSFDFDTSSVACTRELRNRFFADDPAWKVEQGSVLDQDFLRGLGEFDVVYSWGVLHHTGQMWKALENVGGLVRSGGTLFISIYNDEGPKSTLWWKVKRLYNRSEIGKALVCGSLIPYFFLRVSLSCIMHRENLFATYKKNRGMSITHDWYDWLGGFPFEVAKVEELFRFYTDKGFTLRNLVSTNGLATNQLVFRKD